MPSNEHVPPTDEELAGLIELAKGMQRASGLQPEKVATASADRRVALHLSAAVVALYAERDKVRVFWESRAKAFEAERDEAKAEIADLRRELSGKHWAESEQAEFRRDRTLTLPNGTVVRAGDVLVTGTGFAVRVTGVGRESFFAVAFVDDSERPYWGEDPCCTWRQWSEVYPDRPVPRGYNGR